jgi:hypothetical protein
VVFLVPLDLKQAVGRRNTAAEEALARAKVRRSSRTRRRCRRRAAQGRSTPSATQPSAHAHTHVCRAGCPCRLALQEALAGVEAVAARAEAADAASRAAAATAAVAEAAAAAAQSSATSGEDLALDPAALSVVQLQVRGLGLGGCWAAQAAQPSGR